jgi:hypothetical protein
MSEPNKQWYVGSQNDALFIINTPPRPSNDDARHDRPDGPTVVLSVHGLDPEKVQQIVDAHNDGVQELLLQLDQHSRVIKSQSDRLNHIAELLKDVEPMDGFPLSIGSKINLLFLRLADEQRKVREVERSEADVRQILTITSDELSLTGKALASEGEKVKELEGSRDKAVKSVLDLIGAIETIRMDRTHSADGDVYVLQTQEWGEWILGEAKAARLIVAPLQSMAVLKVEKEVQE